MKKIGLLAAALCLFSADAGAAFVSPYVGADYNYSSLNFGRESEDFYADNFNSLGVVLVLFHLKHHSSLINVHQ